MEKTITEIISMARIAWSIINNVSVPAGALFTYLTWRITKEHFATIETRKNKNKRPHGSFFTYLSKFAWVFFVLPLLSIAYFLSSEQLPTHWSVVVISLNVAVFLLNSVTLFVTKLVLRISALEQNETTQGDVDKKVESLENRIRAIELRPRQSMTEIFNRISRKQSQGRSSIP